MELHTHPPAEVLVIGGGPAGMQAALAACRAGAQVDLVSKGRLGRSGNGVISLSVHRFAPEAPGLRADYRRRFLASGAGVPDPAVGERLIEEGARAVQALCDDGLPLEQRCLEEDGRQWPYLACCNPKLGLHLTTALAQRLRSQPRFAAREGEMAFELVTSPHGRVAGALCETDGEIHFRPAAAVILATGGAGNIYARSSNTRELTGNGYAMALRAGLPLRDMEFFQFYPYHIYSPRSANIFPDIFSRGAVYRNGAGARFMEAYPLKEQENRNILARVMYDQDRVELDLSACDMDYLAQECPEIFKMHRDCPDQPLLVTPVAHFAMGGIPLQPDCATALPGLYVCGEVTGGLHGANRLQGSALTECAVFGPIAGRSAAAWARDHAAADTLPAVSLPQLGEDDLAPLKARLQAIMWEKASVVRELPALAELLTELDALEAALSAARPRALRPWLELRSLLLTARSVAAAALARPESLGAHYLR